METNKNINGEDLLREKMLGEEFSFEPEAWAKMEDLLDKRQHPVPPPPGPSSGNNGSNRIFRWLALLLLLLTAWWYLYERSGDMTGNNMAVSSVLETSGRKTDQRTEIGNPAKPGAATRQTTPSQQTTDAAVESLAGDANQTHAAASTAAAGTETTAANHLSEPQETKNTATPLVQTGSDAPETLTAPLAQATTTQETGLTAKNITQTKTPDTRTTAGADSPGAVQAIEQEIAAPASAAPNAYARMSNMDNLETVLIPLDDIIRPVKLKQFDVQPKSRRVLLIGYGLGFNAALPQYGLGQVKYAPHISLATRYNFNQKLALRTEISLRKVDGYALSATFSDSTFRPTGELLWYKYQPGTPGFLFVDMPVLLTYKLGKSRSAAMLGLRPALVFPSDHWLTQSGNYTPPQGFNDVSQGVRRFDLAATIGWEFHIAPRFYVDVRYSQGWYDLSHDNFFQNTQTHLSSDIQVSFRHFFTQK